MKIIEKITVRPRYSLAIPILTLLFILSMLLIFWIKLKPKSDMDVGVTIFGTSVLFILAFWFGIKPIKERNKILPEQFIEFYDDGWIRIKCGMLSKPEIFPDFRKDHIIKIWYNKKYIKRSGEWKIGIEFSIAYDGKAYILHGMWGILINPSIEKVDRIMESLQKQVKINKQRPDFKYPPMGFWNQAEDWLNNPEAIKIKIERDKMREKAGIPADYSEKEEGNE